LHAAWIAPHAPPIKGKKMPADRLGCFEAVLDGPSRLRPS